ncbi:MAG: VWA domain-containing protein [Actinomycetia bacterium]|nr:VWA domain-containing protein [Actinomycetes bacterium]
MTAATNARVSDVERSRRWRMVLGGIDEGETEQPGMTAVRLDGHDARIDAALAALYDAPRDRRGGGSRAGGLGSSAPAVARWLGDIRRYFPTSVVQVLQRDAIDRLKLRQLLLEPEMLRAVEPDLHLVTLLVELNRLLPDATRATARKVVAQVVDQIEQRLAARTKQAVRGALARSQRTRRPRPSDIDWGRTIHANLRHYLPDQQTVIPERLVGYGRRQRSLARDVIVAIDQSASMADSVVYASVFGAVLASIPAFRTHVVAFDVAVADLTPLLHDPVDVLFGVQLGGGTDIAQAVGYCQQLITRPADTLLILVTDLFEGGNAALLHDRIAALAQAGVCVVVLLALSDEGAPAYDHAQAAALAEMGVPSFACTPDAFPELLAAALEGRDVGRWANEHGLHTAAAVVG